MESSAYSTVVLCTARLELPRARCERHFLIRLVTVEQHVRATSSIDHEVFFAAQVVFTVREQAALIVVVENALLGRPLAQPRFRRAEALVAFPPPATARLPEFTRGGERCEGREDGRLERRNADMERQRGRNHGTHSLRTGVENIYGTAR